MANDGSIILSTEVDTSGVVSGMSKIKSAAGSVGKAFATVGTAAAAGFTAITAGAVSSYAEFEQLKGGVETLFKDSAGTLMTYADAAYKNAGMSANAFMNNITSFSAAMINSVGGDTAKAVELANDAVIAMSDNANKMGTDINSITLTYQSLSRGNVAMLDNLKLGYGGTKAELERLLADAEEYKASMGEIVNYDVSNFADITQAIGAIQEKLGIAGATAAEASTTIQGSANAMKAAWQNLLTGIADPTQDFETLVSNFTSSVKTYMSNLIPVVGNAIKGTVQLFKELVPDIVSEIKTQVPKIAEAGKELFSKIADKAPDAIKNLTSKVSEIVSAIAGKIKSAAPKVLEAGTNLFEGLISGAGKALPKIIDSIPSIIDGVLSSLSSAVPLMLEAGKTLFGAITDALPSIIDAAATAIPQIVSSIVGFLGENIPKIVQTIGDMFTSLIGALPDALNAALVPLAAITAGILAYKVAVVAVNAVTAAKTAIDAIHTQGLAAATAAQLGLNAAVLANPFMWAAAGVAALTAGVALYTAKSKAARQEELERIRAANGLTEAEKELLDGINQTSEAYIKKREAQIESNKGIVAESEHIKALWEELKTIIDANGVIKEGYEERAAVIVGVLNQALGTEIEIVGNQIAAYEQLANTIDKVIEKKKTEALISANQQAYGEAVQGVGDALTDYLTTQETATRREEIFAEKQAQSTAVLNELNAARTEYNNLVEKSKTPEGTTHAEKQRMAELGSIIGDLTIAWQDAEEAASTAFNAYSTAANTAAQAEETYIGMANTITNYENLLGASVSGNAEEIDDATVKITNGFINAENATRESLENQAKNFKNQYDNLKKAVESGMPGVTKAQVDAMQKLVWLSVEELVKFDNQAAEAGKKGGESFGNGVGDTKNSTVSTSKDVADGANEALGSADTEQTGQQKGQEFAGGIAQTEWETARTGAAISRAAKEGMGEADTASTGTEKAEEFAGGITDGTETVQSAGENISTTAKDGMGSKDATSEGSEIVNTYASGMKSNTGVISSAISAIMETLKSGFSGLSLRDIGANLIQGLIDGMKSVVDGVGGVVETARDVISKVFKSMKDEGEIYSPSRRARDEIGKMISAGIGIGIEEGEDYITSALDNLLTNTREGVQSELDGINDDLLESERFYAEESERLKESISVADKKYLDDLKGVAEEERELYESRKDEINAFKEEIVSEYKDIASQALSSIEELRDAQKEIENKLSDYGELLIPEKFTDANGQEFTKYVLPNMDEQSAALENYYKLLTKVKERGEVPPEFFALLRDLDIDEAVKLASALLSATDEEFDAYIRGWQKNQQLAENISKELYADEAKNLSNEIKSAFSDVNDYYFLGSDIANEFSKGFLEKFKNTLSEIGTALSSVFSDLLPSQDYAYAVNLPMPSVANGSMLPSFLSPIAGGISTLGDIGKIVGDAVGEKLQEIQQSNLTGSTVVVLEVDGTEFGRVALDQISQAARIKGVDLVVT